MHYLFAVINRIKTLIYLIIIKVCNFSKFNFDGISVISISSLFKVSGNGYISLGKNIGIRRWCEISASENGEINISDRVFMNNGCMLVAHSKIDIGEGTRMGPHVMIFDHDYIYNDADRFEKGEHTTAPIIIGKNCWIGAGAIILKGSKIGNNCTVGAGAVIKGTYADNSLVIQKRNIQIHNIGEKNCYEKNTTYFR